MLTFICSLTFTKMVCDGPDPPDDSPQNLIPPPRHDLIANGNHEDSDEENNEYFGYEPLPQGPESVLSDHDSGDEAEVYIYLYVVIL